MSRTVVEINNLCKQYRQGFRKKPVKAVDHLSLNVPEGSVIGLIGPNGAGKTTTIYCMLGLLIPDEGSISILGKSPQDVNSRNNVGYQSEIFHTYDFLKPRQVLTLYGKLSGMDSPELDTSINTVLDRMGLANSIHQKVGTFSKGMKQRLGIAQALLHNPSLLILDEPFTGLDPQGRKVIIDLLGEEKDRGNTVFFSSHILSDVERLCDHIVMIRNGRVVMEGNLGDITTIGDRWSIEINRWEKKFDRVLKPFNTEVTDHSEYVEVTCDREEKNEVLRGLVDLPVEIVGIRPKTQSLEDLYMKLDEEEEEVDHA